MTKIKFIDARIADPDEDEFALKRRFEWHLRKLRALRDRVSPKVPGDFEDELRWNEDLIAVHLSEKDRTRILRRARRVMRARAKVSGLSHLSSDDRRALEVFRGGADLVGIASDQVGFDVSWISWVMTSNSLSTLPAPFLNRLDILRLAGPGKSDLISFAEREGARRGLSGAALGAICEVIDHVAGEHELNLRHVSRMLDRARVTNEQVLRRFLAGDLRRVYRLSGAAGFKGVVVDPKEFMSVDTSPLPGMSLDLAQVAFGVTTAALSTHNLPSARACGLMG